MPRVTIYGPNLADQHLGTFHVHDAGCQCRPPRDLLEAGPAEGWTVDVDSRWDAVLAVYSDHLAERTPDELLDPGEPGVATVRDSFYSDLHFAPCLKDLPEGDWREVLAGAELIPYQEPDRVDLTLAEELIQMATHLGEGIGLFVAGATMNLRWYIDHASEAADALNSARDEILAVADTGQESPDVLALGCLPGHLLSDAYAAAQAYEGHKRGAAALADTVRRLEERIAPHVDGLEEGRLSLAALKACNEARAEVLDEEPVPPEELEHCKECGRQARVRLTPTGPSLCLVCAGLEDLR